MSDASSLRNWAGRPGAQQPMGTEIMQRWVIVRHTTAWHPPTDVYEIDDRLVVVVEIAGMRDGDFNVTLQGQRLTISGTRRRMTGPDCAYYQLEISFGDFRTPSTCPGRSRARMCRPLTGMVSCASSSLMRRPNRSRS